MRITKRSKILKDLEARKEYIISDGRVYFLSVNDYPVSLPEKYYFKRKEELRKYFSDRDEKEQKRLILENLGLLATPLPDKDYPIPKITIFRDSCWATTIKIENYAEDDPQWGDNKEIMFKRSLTDARGNVLDDIEQESWNTAREREDPRIMEFARKIRDWLRGD